MEGIQRRKTFGDTWEYLKPRTCSMRTFVLCYIIVRFR